MSTAERQRLKRLQRSGLPQLRATMREAKFDAIDMITAPNGETGLLPKYSDIHVGGQFPEIYHGFRPVDNGKLLVPTGIAMQINNAMGYATNHRFQRRDHAQFASCARILRSVNIDEDGHWHWEGARNGQSPVTRLDYEPYHPAEVLCATFSAQHTIPGFTSGCFVRRCVNPMHFQWERGPYNLPRGSILTADAGWRHSWQTDTAPPWFSVAEMAELVEQELEPTMSFGAVTVSNIAHQPKAPKPTMSFADFNKMKDREEREAEEQEAKLAEAEARQAQEAAERDAAILDPLSFLGLKPK